MEVWGILGSFVSKEWCPQMQLGVLDLLPGRLCHSSPQLASCPASTTIMHHHAIYRRGIKGSNNKSKHILNIPEIS